MSQKLLTIHKRILKDKLRELETDVKRRAPEIQKEHMIHEFIKTVNTFKFKERLNLAWRVLWRML